MFLFHQVEGHPHYLINTQHWKKKSGIIFEDIDSESSGEEFCFKCHGMGRRNKVGLHEKGPGRFQRRKTATIIFFLNGISISASIFYTNFFFYRQSSPLSEYPSKYTVKDNVLRRTNFSAESGKQQQIYLPSTFEWSITQKILLTFEEHIVCILSHPALTFISFSRFYQFYFAIYISIDIFFKDVRNFLL